MNDFIDPDNWRGYIMTDEERKKHLEIIRKRKAEIDKRQRRIAKEIKLWEAIERGDSKKIVQALTDYFKK